MTSRLLYGLAVLALLAAAPAQAAPGAQSPAEKAGAPAQDAANAQKSPGKATAPAKDTAWSEADYKAARERDEARYRLSEKRMRALTGSICNGC